MPPRKTPLRVVKPDESAPAAKPKPPSSVVSALESGGRVDELRAMQMRVARAIDDPNTPARDLASLTRRQIEIGREIDAIEKAAEEEAAEDAAAATPDEPWDAANI